MVDNGEPLALLITWTCYGQWLPGDARGYVSNTVLDDGYQKRRNVIGTPFDRNDPRTFERAKLLQKHPSILLTTDQAHVVADSITAAARERGWSVLRGAIMANHAHMLMSNCPDDGPAVRRVLKGVSQAALSRAVGGIRRWWTRGGSDRYKHGHTAIAVAMRYVDKQDRALARIANNVVIFPKM